MGAGAGVGVGCCSLELELELVRVGGARVRVGGSRLGGPTGLPSLPQLHLDHCCTHFSTSRVTHMMTHRLSLQTNRQSLTNKSKPKTAIGFRMTSCNITQDGIGPPSIPRNGHTKFKIMSPPPWLTGSCHGCGPLADWADTQTITHTTKQSNKQTTIGKCSQTPKSSLIQGGNHISATEAEF